MSHVSSDRSFSDIDKRFVLLFLFLQKASKKQAICYSIAVKNACFCWVIECIAPSIYALTEQQQHCQCEGYRLYCIFLTSHPAVSGRTCYTHHYFQAWVWQETCDQSEQFPDSCINESTIISLYHSIYINITCGIGYYWCPSVWEILYKLKIPDTDVYLFCFHYKLLTSSKALTFVPRLRPTLFNSTVQRSVPKKRANGALNQPTSQQ